MKENIRRLHVKRTIWKFVEILYVGFFSFVNDNKNVDVKCLQTMKYIFCYNSPLLVCNPKTRERENFVMYNKTNGIATLKKHENADHFIIAKMFGEEMNSLLREEVEKQLAKKRLLNPFGSLIVNFLSQTSFPKRSNGAKIVS